MVTSVFVINTHVHGDHVGGNENLGRMGLTIMAQDRVRLRLAERGAPRWRCRPSPTARTSTIHLKR